MDWNVGCGLPDFAHIAPSWQGGGMNSGMDSVGLGEHN
jgi:hypothetical protein